MRDEGLSFEIGSVLVAEYDASGFLGVQVDALGGQTAATATIALHAPYGLSHMPLAAQTDANGNVIAATRSLFARDGAEQHAWLLEDPRIVGALPALQPGESLFYGPTSNYVHHQVDGGVVLSGTYFNAQAPSVHLGPGPNFDNVVLATPLANIVSALQTLLGVLSTTLLTPVVTGKPVDSGQFETALSNFNTAIASLVQSMRAPATEAS